MYYLINRMDRWIDQYLTNSLYQTDSNREVLYMEITAFEREYGVTPQTIAWREALYD